MKQSHFMSLVESLSNVAIGYGIAVETQILVFPLFGAFHHTCREHCDGRYLHRCVNRTVLHPAPRFRSTTPSE